MIEKNNFQYISTQRFRNGYIKEKKMLLLGEHVNIVLIHVTTDSRMETRVRRKA